MTISIATLFEYVTYNVVLSTEKDYYSENSRTLHLTEETLNELEKINKTNKFLDIGRKTLKPRNCIGVVKAGSITIDILPKLFKDDRYEQHGAVIASNLLKMLS